MTDFEGGGGDQNVDTGLFFTVLIVVSINNYKRRVNDLKQLKVHF